MTFENLRRLLTLTYIDVTPAAALERQFISLPSSSGIRLPLSGFPSNDTSSRFTIGIQHAPPSTTLSPSYPFSVTQASAWLMKFQTTFVSADTLQDLVPLFPYR